jgi:hypothetical protein
LFRIVDKYREPFYLLVAQEKRDEPLRIVKHTVPHFIPLRDLEKKFLNVDMDASITIIYGHKTLTLSLTKSYLVIIAHIGRLYSIICVTARANFRINEVSGKHSSHQSYM